ncbi:MAG: hypothetical protein U0Q12_27190 [Vicinamibacterales bacterium]
MVIVDRALADREREGRPIRVGLIGAGVAGQQIARQLLTPVAGVRLAAVASRTETRARAAYGDAAPSAAYARTLAGIEASVEAGAPVVCTDAALVTAAAGIDVVVEVTGTIGFAAEATTDAIRHRKHVVLVNAELDATLGPLLKARADEAGVVLTNTDGDEPGVAMTLLRYLRSVGLRPVAAGNLKGMLDRYRTPETQRAFAQALNQDPVKVTSFADGTKLAMEATLVANASGFGIGQRGMYGPRCAHVREMADRLPAEEMLATGLVDYALGAEPHTGAFAIVHEPDALKRRDLAYFKLGDGPFYVFYTPYHLPHVQVVSTIGRAVLFDDATVAPQGAPVCEVVACAKRPLEAGAVLDGIGGFLTYGTIERAGTVARDRLLPIGLAAGCVLTRAVARDAAVSFDDVDVPPGRAIDALYAEQRRRWPIAL